MAVSTEGQAAVAPSQTGEAVRDLLRAYADTLEVVERLPAMTTVALKWPWRLRSSSPRRLPVGTLTVYTFSTRRADRVLAQVERALRRRSALRALLADEADALTAVSEFRASLPSRSWLLRASVLVVVSLVIARVLVALLPSSFATAFGFTGRSGVDTLVEKALGALTPPEASFSSILDGVIHAAPGAVIGAVAVLSFAAYLVLRPGMSMFRLHRLLFNLYPHADSLRAETPGSWSVSRATGVYEIEGRVCAELGCRVPREVPLDLLVPLPVPAFASVLLLAVLVGVILLERALSIGVSDAAIDVLLVLYVVLAPLRLVWLMAAWMARRGRPRWRLMLGLEVVVRWRVRPLSCRPPWQVALVSFGLPPLAWLGWCDTVRDLREMGAALEIPPLERMRLAPQMLAFFTIVLSPIPLILAVKHVRAAQKAVGVAPMSWSGAILLPFWFLFCAMLQNELNRAWEAQGAPLSTSEDIAACAERFGAGR
jgi:hypothetical protein